MRRIEARLAALIVALALPWPGAALAYRPFDSTDAAVADKGVWEIELQPFGWEHNDDGAQWIAPAAIFNYGFADRWETVVEGRNAIFAQGGDELSEVAASLKTVLREGSLQDKAGVSLGSEFSLLLPGIRADDGAGLEWTLLASDRKDWGAWHLNVGPELTRDGRGAMVMGGILEGPSEWPVRPVAELRYEKIFGGQEMFAQLVGLIWPVREGLAFDIAYRHAREGGRPDEQIRAGLTFDLT
jgi:hypothetical protein